jgi:hypothetical protein
MVKLSWVTCPSEEYKEFSKWSHYNGRLAQVKKYKDFSKWSQCNGRPIQVEKYKGFSK